MIQQKICEHLKAITELKQPESYQCKECVKNGSRWVHLRTCQTCGVTLCCDDSPLKHMAAHFRETGHPVIISAEPGEKWMWCFRDEIFVAY